MLLSQDPAVGGLTTASTPLIETYTFATNLGLAALLAFVLGQIYATCGTSLSNRRQFGGNFVLLTMTTMLIISIVKSSLALSLGLVGALSIVRFRAAIKEPEELAYLFFTIAIGLGLGADQRKITLVAFAIIVTVIGLRHWTQRRADESDYCLTVTSTGPQRARLSDVVAALKQHGNALDLKRYDEGKDALEACFVVEFEDLDALERGKAALRELDRDVHVSFLDNKGLV